MKPTDAQAMLEKAIQEAGKSLEELTVAEGLDCMLDFYRGTRAEGCALEDEGDMLLYQWGTFDWGEGRYFQCNITRQFIQADLEDDDAISQLSLTFYFPPSDFHDSLGDGNHWCANLDDLTEFEELIEDNEAYQAVKDAAPETVELEYGQV